MSQLSSTPEKRSSKGENAQLRVALWVVAAAAVLSGLTLILRSWASPLNPQLARYVYGDATITPDDLHQHMVRIAFNWGYLLVLIGCAGIVLLGAASKLGRIVARYVAAAAVIATTSNVVEDLLAHRLNDHKSRFLVAVVGTAIIIKWCSALVALAGVPAAVGILLRALRPSSKVDQVKGWWTEAVEKAPPLSDVQLAADQSIRANAYWVPGAQDVIDDRGLEKVQALCLSGGGVRSACVAMGAMQVFSQTPAVKATNQILSRFPAEPEPTLIDALDYVISVSGGGFSAAARLLAVQSADAADPILKADTGSGLGDYPAGNEAPLISQRFGEGSPEFDYLRRNSSYIADSPAQLISALATLFKNLLASLSILFLLPVLLGWTVGYLLSRADFSFAALVPVPNPNSGGDFRSKHRDHYLLCLLDHHGSWWAVAFFAGWAMVFTIAAIVVEMRGWRTRNEKAKLGLQRFALGSTMFAALILTIAVGLPALMRLCNWVFQHATENHGAAAATASGVVGLNYLAAVAAIGWKDRKVLTHTEATKLSWWRQSVPSGFLPIILVTATFGMLAIAWLVTLGSVAAGVFDILASSGVDGTHRPLHIWLFVVSAVALVIISMLDVTSLSLHPYYRSRLGRAFAVRRVKTESGRDYAERYAENEYTWLVKYGRVHAVPSAPLEGKPGVPAGGPKFVFAAAAALSGNGRPAPGLNAVPFVLSSDYIGGPELGYWNTWKLFKHAPDRIKRDLTVITAVAVSGAAFASAMGRYQRGFEKLLAASGARLGTWLPNPKFFANLDNPDRQDAAKVWPKALPQIRGAGYFYRELLGLNYKNARLVQVTDGGHYDNLGLVEALRRRCRLIICIDGGGDTPPLFSGLAESVRLATYELGVSVDFEANSRTRNAYDVADIAPGSGDSPYTKTIFPNLKPRLAKHTVATAVITYPSVSGLDDTGEQHVGLLIYAKAVLCEACPPWLLTYAAAHEQFPHDPTSDQWFNEGQFAAYTELGKIMAGQVRDCLKDHGELK